jgi:anion-transporting  ArsA/GET3 family ATPase
MMASLWANRRVVVCVGTGGVGKTTVAAAMAVAAARSGRRVAVMTIDPSRRLSQALGLDAHNPTLQRVPLDKDGAGPSGGSLHALMLDVQHTFDALIKARARTPAHAEAILQNRIYRHFSASLAGSHEYAAVEKLYDVYEDPAFDLVILDTPPSHHALDFLDAPGRILRFLQGQDAAGDDGNGGPSLAQRMGRKLFDLGGSLVTRTVGKISGAQTLQEVMSFLLSLKDMYASFNTRAAAVQALLQSDQVAFTLVGGPSPAQISALEQFANELGRFNIKPAAWVLNRMHPLFLAAEDRPYAAQRLAALQEAPAVLSEGCQRLGDAIDEELAIASRDQEQLDKLQRGHPGALIVRIEDAPQGADSLERLTGLSRTLAPSSE